MKTDKKTIKVALYGMDERSYKMMNLYLQGPCKGIAVVVDDSEAEIDIIDADCSNARDILESRRAKAADRPIILMSLEPLSIAGTVYVKKPVTSEDLISALKGFSTGLATDNKQGKPEKDEVAEVIPKKMDKAPPLASETEVAEEKKTELKEKIDLKEKKKVFKHRTAKDLTDDIFPAYLGHVTGIDFSDTEQVIQASFNSKSYFLGYLKYAVKVAKDKGRVVKLNTSWNPLIIFPESNEIWLDSEEMQLRAFSGIEVVKFSDSGMSLSTVDHKKFGCSDKLECFFDSDVFLWKVAIWTSKGRYPDSLDIHRPVFLKQWPNFTRLLITPHALQITALLMIEPRSLLDVVETLKIKPEYVFVFISAAHAIGLVGQSKRISDELIAPAEIKQPKTKNLLGRILGKLRH